MTVRGRMVNNGWVYCDAGETPLTFILVGDIHKGFYLRLEQADLFLSYREVTGAVKLFSSPNQARYALEKVKPGVYAIKNLHWNQYLWLSGSSPYLSKAGNPKNANAQWVIEGLPSE